jgi:hypothetical protein
MKLGKEYKCVNCISLVLVVGFVDVGDKFRVAKEDGLCLRSVEQAVSLHRFYSVVYIVVMCINLFSLCECLIFAIVAVSTLTASYVL